MEKGRDTLIIMTTSLQRVDRKLCKYLLLCNAYTTSEAPIDILCCKVLQSVYIIYTLQHRMSILLYHSAPNFLLIPAHTNNTVANLKVTMIELAHMTHVQLEVSKQTTTKCTHNVYIMCVHLYTEALHD